MALQELSKNGKCSLPLSALPEIMFCSFLLCNSHSHFVLMPWLPYLNTAIWLADSWVKTSWKQQQPVDLKKSKQSFETSWKFPPCHIVFQLSIFMSSAKSTSGFLNWKWSSEVRQAVHRHFVVISFTIFNDAVTISLWIYFTDPRGGFRVLRNDYLSTIIIILLH